MLTTNISFELMNNKRFVADLICIIGPDNENKNCNQLKFKSMISVLENKKNLTYVILGDGNSQINITDISRLPSARHVIINGHGIVKKSEESKENESHHIKIGNGVVCTLNLLRKVVSQTKSDKILVISCYSGKINEDIKNNSTYYPEGMEVITNAAIDDTSIQGVGYAITMNLINRIKGESEMDWGDFFANLVKKFPDTMTYAVYKSEALETVTMKREERGLKENHDTKRWIQYNLTKLNDFIKDNKLSSRIDFSMSDFDVEAYRQYSFVLYVMKGDMDIVLKLLMKEHELGLNPSLNPFVLDRLFENKYSNDVINYISEHYPDDLFDYYTQFTKLSDRLITCLLVTAAKNNRVEIVSTVLDQASVNIDAKITENDETLMHIAAGNGKANMVRFLLKNNADINAVDLNGNTPLICAVINGKYPMVKRLIRNGADVYSADSGGNTAIHLAAEKGFIKTVAKLLFCDNRLVHLVNSNGKNALDIAVKMKNIEVENLLLDNGAIPANNKTPVKKEKKVEARNNSGTGFSLELFEQHNITKEYTMDVKETEERDDVKSKDSISNNRGLK